MTPYDIIALTIIIFVYSYLYKNIFKNGNYEEQIWGVIVLVMIVTMVGMITPLINYATTEDYIKETIEIKTIVKMNDAEVRENKNKAFVFYKDGRMEIRDVNEVESVKFGQKICRFYGLFGLFKSEQEISPRKLIKTPEKE